MPAFTQTQRGVTVSGPTDRAIGRLIDPAAGRASAEPSSAGRASPDSVSTDSVSTDSASTDSASTDRASTVRALRERITAMQAVSLDSRVLPTAASLQPLLPGGAMKAGVAYSVPGSTSLAMLLLAGPSAAGAWTGVVGVPDFGIEAAAAFGIDLGRLVLVPDPGEHWLTVAAQLADVLNVVLVQPPARQVRDAEASRLASRLRQRGASLVVLGPWQQAEAVLEVVSSRWAGLGAGHGYLAGRETVVAVTARGGRTVRHPLRLVDDTLLPAGTALQPAGTVLQQVATVELDHVRAVGAAAGAARIAAAHRPEHRLEAV